MNMFLSALATTIIIFSTSVQAQRSHWTNEEVEAVCGSTSKTAGLIMKGRQYDFALKRMMELATSEEFKTITILAYKQKKWATKENKEAAIVDFSNDIYMICLEKRGSVI